MSNVDKKRNRMARSAKAKMDWLQRSLTPWTRQILQRSFFGQRNRFGSIRLKQYGQQVSDRFPSLRKKYHTQQFELPRRSIELSLASAPAQVATTPQDMTEGETEPFSEGIEPQITMADLRGLIETRQQRRSGRQSIAAEPIETTPPEADEAPGPVTLMAELRQILATRQPQTQPEPPKRPAPRRIQRIAPAKADEDRRPTVIAPRQQRAYSKVEELPGRPNRAASGQKQEIAKATPETEPLSNQGAQVQASVNQIDPSPEPVSLDQTQPDTDRPSQGAAERPTRETSLPDEQPSMIQAKSAPAEVSVSETVELHTESSVSSDGPDDEAALNKEPTKEKSSRAVLPVVRAKSSPTADTRTPVTTSHPLPETSEPTTQLETEPAFDPKPGQEKFTPLQDQPDEVAVSETVELRTEDYSVSSDGPDNEAALNKESTRETSSLDEQPSSIQAKSVSAPDIRAPVTTSHPAPEISDPPTPVIEPATEPDPIPDEMIGPLLQQPSEAESLSPARSMATHRAQTKLDRSPSIQPERFTFGLARDQGIEPESGSQSLVANVSDPGETIPVAGPKPGILKRVAAIRPVTVARNTLVKRVEVIAPRIKTIQNQSQHIMRHIGQSPNTRKVLADEPLSTGTPPQRAVRRRTTPDQPGPKQDVDIAAHMAQLTRPNSLPLAPQPPTMVTVQKQPTPVQTEHSGVMRQGTGTEATPETTEEAQPDQEIRLDRLARQIYPLIRRRLAIERQQISRW